MISRATRVLFALAVVAIAAFIFLELPRRRAHDRAEREASRLLAFDPAAVDGVRVRRADDELVFAMRNSRWEMLAPVADLAEASAVVSLIQALHDAEVERNLGPDGDDERFGLRAPTAVVWLSAGRDTVAQVELGGYTIDRAYIYARRADGDIVLAPADLQRAATLGVDQYRNRRVVTFDRAQVRSFELRNAAGRSRWVRSGRTAWFTIAAGDTVEGDSTAVEAILRTLRGLRVARFLAPADTAGALDHPDAVITIEYPPPAPAITVRFRCVPGAPCRVRCAHETRVAEIAAGVDALTTADLDRLRDRRLLRFAPERAGRIEISTPDTSAVLVRAGDTWALPNAALGTLDSGGMADFVRTLRSLRWARVVEPRPPSPRPTEAFTLVIYGRDGSVLDEMHGSVQGDPPVLTGTSRSSGLTTESDAATLAALTVGLRRLRR